MKNMFLKWLIFTVFFSLLPIALNAITIFLIAKDKSLLGVIMQGELLLIATAIAAPSIGFLIGCSPENLTLKIILGFFSTVVLLLSSFIYAIIKVSIILKSSYDANSLILISFMLLGLSILVTGTTLIVEEKMGEGAE